MMGASVSHCPVLFSSLFWPSHNSPPLPLLPAFAREECSTVPLSPVTVSDALSQLLLHNTFLELHTPPHCVLEIKALVTITCGQTVRTMIEMSTYL